MGECMYYNLCDGIWAGEYPDKPMIDGLVDRGMRTFLNLTRQDEKLFFGIESYKDGLPTELNYFKQSLYAFGLPPVDEMMKLVKKELWKWPSLS